MPRAALLSIHARMAGAEPASWEDPSLVQVWGPRFSAYVVAERDRAVFTLGRLPDEAGPLKRAQDIAARLGAVLAGARMPFSEAARAMGEQDANRLRYAAPTGTVVMRWDGARQPEIWNVPAPDMEPHEARLELARRYLHVFGPATPEAFATWAGIRPVRGVAAFAALDRSLTPVRTPIGEAWILSEDAPLFSAAAHPPAPARLLPSGDTWFLLQGTAGAAIAPYLAPEGPFAARRAAELAERQRRNAPHRSILVRWGGGAITVNGDTATAVTQETWSNQEAGAVAPEQATSWRPGTRTQRVIAQ